VGIGASAGGIEALTQLLSHLPPDTGMAFVVIQHLAPTHPSLLKDVLVKTTSMPVTEAQPHGAVVEPNHVYVIPPNTDLAIRNGVLHVLTRLEDARRPHLPIDAFFRSLAGERKTTAIGVVLSGASADGTQGLKAIKVEGGISFAQDPQTAKYPTMPESAISAGAVDYVLAPEQIAVELARLATHPYVRRPLSLEQEAPSKSEKSEAVIESICALVHKSTGVNFTAYKSSTVRRRIARRMTVNKVERLQDYLALLKTSSSEARALCEDMLIHVTGFFRDPEVFEAIKTGALPELVQQKQKDELVLRIWVPGCSTGEEVYSIAIVLAEFLGDGLHRAVIQIFGSDVSEAAVEKARAATYLDAVVRDVGADRLGRFFTKVDGGYRISKQIRELCVFVKHDVTRDPPFTHLDLISCRNVLIYFSAALQKKVVPLLHYALNDTGFLLLGRTETIGGYDHLFSLQDRANKIYKRKSVPARLAPVLPAGLPTDVYPKPVPHKPREFRWAVNDLQRETDRMLQARYGPPAVVVNEAWDIVSTRGRTGPYLELPSGEARLNVLTIAREGLLSDLRLALHYAKKQDATVRREGAHVRVNGETRAVHIEVCPIKPAAPSRERYFLVVFEEVPTSAAEMGAKRPGRKTSVRGQRDESPVVKKLREELGATRGYLQSVIEDHTNTNEELASANEEMLSVNEELQSTNEELETAKEELQSTNEELTTVNDELQTRNTELTQANNDLLNVMGSIEVPIVLVSSDRRIRRFTPRAADVMNLIPSDLGRPIRDINPNVEVPDLDRWITGVIDTMEVKDAEVRDRDGRWHRLQIRPYKTADNQIDGAVISLVEIDAPKLALEERERLLERLGQERGLLDAVVQQIPAGVIVAEAPSGRLILGNKRIEEIFKQSLPPAANISEYPAWRGFHPDSRPYQPAEWPLARSLANGEVISGEQIVLQRGDGSYATVFATSAPIRDAAGHVFAGVVAFLDATEQVAERARLEREQKLLAETSTLLGEVFDIGKTLQRTAGLVVPEFADWCIIDLQEQDRPLYQAAAAHAEIDKEKLARDLARHLPPDPNLSHGVGHVIRTGKSEIYPVISDVLWVASALSAEHPAILRDLGARSYICVPLAARGRVLGALSLVRGEKSERYGDRELRLAEELARRFAAAIETAQLYGAAVDAVRARNEFFSIASHELKTPISTLLLQVQSMRQLAAKAGAGAAPAEAFTNSLNRVERQAHRLDQLVNALMDVSRIASGRFALELDDVDLTEVVKEVIARSEDQAKRADSPVMLRADAPVRGRWDMMRLEQVVMNLLSNAIKYGAGKPIEVNLDADASNARLVVQDHGIGIAAEDLARIFERFERAISARHYAGLGMGLFIARQIVEAHGGTIRATSEPGEGSIFTVELPRKSTFDGKTDLAGVTGAGKETSG
jgi:chemotaxis methyl-accepting protein methylase/signal transduction histidine kinase